MSLDTALAEAGGPRAFALDVRQLVSMIDAGRRLLLLDVRNQEEHASWRIEGLQPVQCLHLPYFEFIENHDAALARIPSDAAMIAVLCAKGGSSELVAGMLRDSGRDARNVMGGMVAYGEQLWSTRI